MAPYEVTEGPPIDNQGFRTNADIDSDDPELSSEEESSPDELIQGPSTGFSKRGKQKADSAGNKAPKKEKDQTNMPPQKITERKTPIPPPTTQPNPTNYPSTKKWCIDNLSSIC